ncbi:MAG: hypothetical protein GX444_03585 [Myxococcales bacterium]|nr:hypothetical protein [Myxococcales bacterium]
MKTILVLALLVVFTPMIFSCAENENASDDNNDETNDDDSVVDDDSANDDDDQSNADLGDHPTYPETNLEFVGVNFFYRESPVYPWDDGFYDANFYHYAKQKWQLKYQISADNTDFIKQIWGPSTNEVFAIGSTKGLFMSTPLILFYHDGEWEDISLFYPSTEIVGVGGTSSDNVYFVANVDKNIDPDITDLDH